MYVLAVGPKEPEGLGFAWVIPIIAAVASAFAGPVAVRLISGPSSTSQKAVEAQLKLQQQLEVQRMYEQQKIQQQQTEQLAKYALPALGLVALVAVLR